VHEGPPPGQNARQLGGVKMPRPHRERDRMAPVSTRHSPPAIPIAPRHTPTFRVLLALTSRGSGTSITELVSVSN
jgi:hypothetical protein